MEPLYSYGGQVPLFVDTMIHAPILLWFSAIIYYDLLFHVAESENLWVLTNLTDPLTLKSLGSYNQGFNGFTSNSNSSLAQLYSFARPSLSNLANFTDIFNNAVENDYTSAMWDEDTTLVIYIFNLSSPMTFKITVDQQDFLFLLYFFITFITYVHA